MKYLLALDQGTTSSRAIVFASDSTVISVAQREFTQHFPQSGWVEHDAREIWSTQLAVALHALEKARQTIGISAKDIAAIGITNQRETTVVWDKATGEPIHNAIVWQDRRTAGHCNALREAGHESVIRHATGLLLDPYFSGTKVAWILDSVAGARARAERGELAFGTIDSWLTWNLTGATKSAGAVHLTDVTNASRTMLFDIRKGDWSQELCDIVGVPMQVLPQVVASSQVVATTSAFGGSIPIAGIAGDQQSALFGQTCFEAGMAKNTYGTGCFMLRHAGAVPVEPPDGLLLTAACQRQGQSPQYAIEGSVFIGGAVVQWLRDGMGLIKTASQVESLAASVADSGGAMFVPAFTGLGAPYWDPEARAALVGLSRGTTAAHVARAALEAIAFQSTDLISAMQQSRLSSLRVDGGASANNLLMQLQADISGVPVIRPKILETTALGAAYLAGLATGVWASSDELSRQWQIDRVFEPATSLEERNKSAARWAKAVAASRQFGV